MSLLDQINFQREFYSLSQERVLARVQRMGKIAIPRLHDVVTEAVAVVVRSKGQQENVGPHADVLARTVASHYELLLKGVFDENLEESYHELHDVLNMCRRDSRLLLSVDAVAMRGILKEAASHLRWRPFEFAKCSMAMGSLFSFDVSVMLHLQIEIERAALRTKEARIDSEITIFRDEITDLSASVENATGELSTVVDHVESAASATATKSGKAASSVADSASSLKMSSQSVEELEVSIDQIASQAERSAQLAGNAVTSAERSGVSMRELTNALTDIDVITRMIGNIAAQTNLLALNATIEAARAGEAGRGFAVVASEVKALVNQVERATADINSILQNVRNAARTSEQEIGAINGGVYSLSDNAMSVAVAVQQQKSAVSEIRDHMTAIIANNQSINENLDSLVISSSSSASYAGSLNTVVDDLHERSKNLHKAFDRFATTLRSA